MKINMSVVVIICQTFAAIGFGIFFTLLSVMKEPGGQEIVASLWETTTVPVTVIIIIGLLNLFGTVSITIHNVTLVLKNKTKTLSELREEEF